VTSSSATTSRAVPPEKDYSATPLWKKLGIKDGHDVVLIGAPDGFQTTLDVPPLARVHARPTNEADVILLFSARKAHLERRFANLASRLDPAGGLWIAWPKRSSKIETDLSFEDVQRIGLGAGLVDNKSCSIDRAWQAVRFVYRLKDRPGAR
jgi:hypothetical protein